MEEELENLFKKRFHKKVDRDIWIYKYVMALTELHLIEGMIGMRQKPKKKPLGEERSSKVKEQ